MRILRFVLGAVVWISYGAAIPAQQIASQTSQAMTILRQTLGLLTAGAVVSDVTLTGTARRVAGSDDEAGTAVLKALSTGEARMDLGLPSGPCSEVWANTGSLKGNLTGQWSGPDGVAHAMALHNLLTDSSWFFPALTLNRWLSIPGYAVSLVGQESRNGETVEHITVFLLATAFPPNMSTMFQHLSQTEIYLDSASGLPVAFAFQTHPDNNSLQDIPVEIRLSNYQAVNGVQVPFHVQKYLNNNLFLDIQFQTAILNSGLNASSFTIQ